MGEVEIRYKPLDRSFYLRRSDEVARDLLGKHLARRIDGRMLVGKIVEVEAYFGEGDPASHASRGMTLRNAPMFGPPGYSYIYLNYGMHWLLNVVAQPVGSAAAVLIRAIEPVEGIGDMLLNRPVPSIYELGSGPGKLTQALKIGPELNGVDMTDPKNGLYIAEGKGIPKIRRSSRVGISEGTEHLLRFFVEGSAFISKK